MKNLPKFLPLVLSWDSNSPRSQLWLTILTCFGAGVILTTTVTHMMPEVSHFIRYNIEHGIQGGHWIYKLWLTRGCVKLSGLWGSLARVSNNLSGSNSLLGVNVASINFTISQRSQLGMD